MDTPWEHDDGVLEKFSAQTIDILAFPPELRLWVRDNLGATLGLSATPGPYQWAELEQSRLTAMPGWENQRNGIATYKARAKEYGQPN